MNADIATNGVDVELVDTDGDLDLDFLLGAIDDPPRLFRNRLQENGATSVLLEIPWAEHAFDALPNGLSSQIALYYTERFFAWALR